MTWTERGLHPQPWHIGHGCITAERETDGSAPSTEDLMYYGGAFVCESITEQDAAFIMVAIRQRDLLLQWLVEREHTFDFRYNRYREGLAVIEREVQPEIFRAKAIEKFRDAIRYNSYPYVPRLLPELASRSRTEPFAEVFVPSGRFVTDNIELDWANKGNGRCDTTPFYDFDKGSGKWRQDTVELTTKDGDVVVISAEYYTQIQEKLKTMSEEVNAASPNREIDQAAWDALYTTNSPNDIPF